MIAKRSRHGAVGVASTNTTAPTVSPLQATSSAAPRHRRSASTGEHAELSEPYHLDHESNFLLQVAGEKDLYLFDCSDPLVLSERDIERYYLGDFHAARYRDELQPRAAAYRMVPGVAAHHPSLAPTGCATAAPYRSASASASACAHSTGGRVSIR